METFEHLYDESENAKVRFLGFASEHSRYDFGIVYTHKFYGKPLVICMQTGQSTLLCSEDALNPGYLKKTFRLKSEREAKELSAYLRDFLPTVSFEDQY